MIFDRAYKPKWEEIKCQKLTMINKNNNFFFSRRRGISYHRHATNKQKHERQNDNPFKIIKVYANGTVNLLRNDRVKQRCSIRLNYPYREQFLFRQGGECTKRRR